MNGDESLIQVRNLKKHYPTREQNFISELVSELRGTQRHLKAVDDVSFDIRRGEILGVAGQSGCGKSTLGELLVNLQQPTEGRIRFDGNVISDYSKSQLQAFRRRAQIVFQDPYEALNPRFTVAKTVSEPLRIHDIGTRDEREERMFRTLEDTGLRPPGAFLNKLPAELSGGERQRVCIARSLVLEPDFLVADEPVSMLDVSVRTDILHLFKELREARNLTMFYVSHDLSTINYLSDRTMIMFLGDVVELGETSEVIHNPAHPYTEALLDSVPTPDPDDKRIGGRMEGEIPDPVDMPTGCRFHPYCDYAEEKCSSIEPSLEVRREPGSNRSTACHFPVDE